ncbi:MAG: hypothetical protein HYY48_02950 [Gammaproteobacteria bacterium]|nr:hypothetical protein [Gammaproteobacteria bacterium]
MTRLVVKPHRPVQFAVAVILLSMFSAMVTWVLLDNIHWSLIFGRLGANEERKQLWNSNRELEKENTSLRERVLALQGDTNLDNQTSVILQNEIRDLQEEIFRLKGELQFYQGVMEASGAGNGLDVHGIFVRPLTQENGFRLKLIMTNVSNTDSDTEGRLDVSFEGIQDGATRYVNLKDVTLDEAVELAFKFRNFKRFESNLEFPAGFSPQRVFVELQRRDEKESNIKRVFDWPRTAN